MRVERVAAAGQAVARGGCAVAERAANRPRVDGAGRHGVEQKFRIREGHATDADDVGPLSAHGGLSDVGEVILQVGVAGADEDHRWRRLAFDDAQGVQLAGDVDQRIMSRLISIAGRNGGGPLDVGRVIRRAGGGVDEADAEICAEGDEAVGFGEIDLPRIGGIDTEAEAIRQKVGKFFGNAGAGFARLGASGVGAVGDEIEQTEAHGGLDGVGSGLQTGHDRAQWARPVFERAAVAAGPLVGPQKLMQQIAVTVFDVDEVRPGLFGDAGGANVGVDEFVHVLIAEDLVVAGHVEFGIEERMAEGHF